MVGIPSWVPLKAMREGVAARARLVKELAALYQRIDQYQNGRPVDYGADMSDIKVTWPRSETRSTPSTNFLLDIAERWSWELCGAKMPIRRRWYSGF
jgi:hypothetical protein